MSLGFYQLLFSSLALTMGVLLLLWLYRNYLKKQTKNDPSKLNSLRFFETHKGKVDGLLRFQFDIPQEMELEVFLEDDKGNRLKEILPPLQRSGHQSFELNTRTLGDGNFFLCFITPYQRITSRLIVNKAI